jgi:hypothetical protein
VRIPIKATAREPIKQAGYISATSATRTISLATVHTNGSKAPFDGRPVTSGLTRSSDIFGVGRPQGAAMTDQSDEVPQDLRNLVRVISACTLGLWAFAAGLLIGVFLFL